jgi:hypothetical protein
MNSATGHSWSEAGYLKAAPIDRLGLVVGNIDLAVSDLRQHGLQVSKPEPLHGENGPLGQVIAHDGTEIEIAAHDPDGMRIHGVNRRPKP